MTIPQTGSFTFMEASGRATPRGDLTGCGRRGNPHLARDILPNGWHRRGRLPHPRTARRAAEASAGIVRAARCPGTRRARHGAHRTLGPYPDEGSAGSALRAPPGPADGGVLPPWLSVGHGSGVPGERGVRTDREPDRGIDRWSARVDPNVPRY